MCVKREGVNARAWLCESVWGSQVIGEGSWQDTQICFMRSGGVMRSSGCLPLTKCTQTWSLMTNYLSLGCVCTDSVPEDGCVLHNLPSCFFIIWAGETLPCPCCRCLAMSRRFRLSEERKLVLMCLVECSGVHHSIISAPGSACAFDAGNNAASVQLVFGNVNISHYVVAVVVHHYGVQ